MGARTRTGTGAHSWKLACARADCGLLITFCRVSIKDTAADTSPESRDLLCQIYMEWQTEAESWGECKAVGRVSHT